MTSNGDAWADFTFRLSDVLAGLVEDQFLILTHDVPVPDDAASYYVQVMLSAEDLYANAVSNTYLAPADQLGAAEQDRLGTLGFAQEAGENWAKTWPRPLRVAEIAQTLVSVLAQVFGIAAPDQLTYESASTTGRDFVITELGIRPDGGSAHPSPMSALDFTPGDDRPARVKAELERVGGHEMTVHANGDLLFSRGSVAVFVRVPPDQTYIDVFSPFVLQLQESPELERAIGSINTRYTMVKFFLAGTDLLAIIRLFGVPLVPEHILSAVDIVGSIADTLAAPMQSAHGGRLMF